MKRSPYGNRVLITGVTGGIGLAIADLFIQNGFRVAGCSRHKSETLPEGLSWFSMDVCNDDSVRMCVEQAVQALGGIDILIHCAGMGIGGSVEDVSPEELMHQLDVNTSVSYTHLNAIVSAVADGGLYEFEIDGQKIALSADDLLIEATQKEGFATAQDYGMTVALDLTMTPALLEEGLLRETVSKIQTMRKERFEVTDRIHIVYQAEEALSQVWERHADRIMKEVLAVSMELGDAASGQAWEINGQKAQILLTKADV